MGIIHQDELDRCDFVDLLEEAAIRKTKVLVKLRDGSTFTDAVKDVVTRDGEDLVDFVEHERVRVADIFGMSRAAPTRH